jgi:very-short-patch-repair endonuclease
LQRGKKSPSIPLLQRGKAISGLPLKERGKFVIFTFSNLFPMNENYLNYNRNLKPLARRLRKEGTKGEAMLWKKVLRARGMEGYQFNRQFPIGNFIVDFICRKLNLIIEVDGSSHLYKGAEDRKRQDFLEEQGYVVIRFTEKEVVFQIDEVSEAILNVVKAMEEENPPDPLLQRGKNPPACGHPL